VSSEIYPGIQRIEVPLPKSPLKAVNCYVIKAGDRALVVDTGMDRRECQDALFRGLKELDADISKTDFFITHLHSDHIGLVSRIADPSAKVYFNEFETGMMVRAAKEGGFGPNMGNFARRAGFTESEANESISRHPGVKYQAHFPIEYTVMHDGDTIEFGDFRFECVHTPGHSPGHLCLFDRERKLMLCGDHVLAEISPNIGAWAEDDDPLREYLQSLDKADALDVELALPGHRRPLPDFHERIAELKAHHAERLDEVQTLLDGQPASAYNIASRMTWDLKYDRWEDVNVMQKWFATGEAIAHLRYLEADDTVRSAADGDVTLYWRS
jgi:glyoxylase-like metal-dependent hydrolase (beta-lactamase superfamily II)